MTDTIEQDMLDRRDTLFKEYKKSINDLNDMRERIREMSDKHEALHKEANDLERTNRFLSRVVDMVIGEDEDPVMAKFLVREQMERAEKENHIDSPRSIGIYAASDREYRRPNRLKRSWQAFRREWNER